MKKRQIPKTRSGIDKKLKELRTQDNISIHDASYICRLMIASLQMDIDALPEGQPWDELRKRTEEMKLRWQKRLDRTEGNLQFESDD